MQHIHPLYKHISYNNSSINIMFDFLKKCSKYFVCIKVILLFVNRILVVIATSFNVGCIFKTFSLQVSTKSRNRNNQFQKQQDVFK